MDELGRNYHRVDGYSLKVKLREARERAGTSCCLRYADDELILGWRDSEWTGIAPFLEEDVAFSSISQNEVGHARALYEIAARELGVDRGRARLRPRTGGVPLSAARRAAEDATGPGRSRGTSCTRRLTRSGSEALKASGDKEVAGLAAKMDREEAYHRIHAQMWEERLRDEPRFQERWTSCGRLRSPSSRTVHAWPTDGRELPPTLRVERGDAPDELAAALGGDDRGTPSVPGAEW